jgi:hypothetical protein
LYDHSGIVRSPCNQDPVIPDKRPRYLGQYPPTDAISAFVVGGSPALIKVFERVAENRMRLLNVPALSSLPVLIDRPSDFAEPP